VVLVSCLDRISEPVTRESRRRVHWAHAAGVVSHLPILREGVNEELQPSAANGEHATFQGLTFPRGEGRSVELQEKCRGGTRTDAGFENDERWRPEQVCTIGMQRERAESESSAQGLRVSAVSFRRPQGGNWRMASTRRLDLDPAILGRTQDLSNRKVTFRPAELLSLRCNFLKQPRRFHVSDHARRAGLAPGMPMGRSRNNTGGIEP
jgi:hypothetical protein